MDDLELTSPDETGAPPAEETLEATLAASREAERAAVERLRQALLASEPAIEPAMVTGSTLAEVEASFAIAQAQVARLRDIVTKETAGRIPPGAPGRARSTARSPFEKIREGLSGGQ
ncbi:MAG: hypothetical protein IT301_05060 [Dehalococcoidia bacterium]|nr:hypothetical protein [Dehalococcoidia bacterium]